jgi:hypothetical protein
VTTRIALLRQRAEAGECELIAKTDLAGVETGYVYVGAGQFKSDRQAVSATTDAALQALASPPSKHPVTFTCVPPGSGLRLGVDSDADGAWDGDERDAGTDPANPASHP